MKKVFLFAAVISILSCSQNDTSSVFDNLKGPYLGQILPGDSALLFAPGIVSTGMPDRDIAIYPDGSEIFFCRNIGNFKYSTIFYVKQTNGKWTKPEVIEFGTNPKYIYIEPCISPDGTKLFFASNMPVEGTEPTSMNIWVSDRVGEKWSKPYYIGTPVNSARDQYFPSVTTNGTLYFTSEDSITNREYIYRSKQVDNKYQEPELLPINVNIGTARFNAFISPDESFIIVPSFGMQDSFGGTDYYIVFRNENDKWSKPINMGIQVNSANGQEWSATLSPDGKFLFFMSGKIPENIQLNKELTKITFDELNNSPQNGNSDIYWISTGFIQRLKEKADYTE